jgi:hypothetical protein
MQLKSIISAEFHEKSWFFFSYHSIAPSLESLYASPPPPHTHTFSLSLSTAIKQRYAQGQMLCSH